jgi:precorrin-4 methylase
MRELHPVIFLGAGPGDPELITVKGQKALARADVVVYAGSLVSAAVLGWARPGAECIDTAPLNLEQILEKIIEAHKAGRRVVRVHSGDPALFSAMQEQLEVLEEAGVPYRVIPGVTAAPAVVAYRVSWPEQQIIRGTLATIAGLARQAGIERQALILVGPALSALEARLQARSKLYDRSFSHGFRPGPPD